MACGPDYSNRYQTSYGCTQGYNYYNGQCCNQAAYTFWTFFFWFSFCCCCMTLCMLM